MLPSLVSSSARDKSAEVVAAASEVSVGSVMVAVAVVPTVGQSVATVQQPGISLSVSLGGRLPLLPAVVAVVVAEAVVAVVAGVGVGSVAVGKVPVADGPVAVGPVEQPGLSLSLRIGLSLSSGLPLLPRLLNSWLGSGHRGGRDNSNETTMSAGHHSAGVVLASGGGGVDDGGHGVGGVGEGRADGVGKVVACGVREGGVGLGVHRGERGSEKQELHDDGAQKMCGSTMGVSGGLSFYTSGPRNQQR